MAIYIIVAVVMFGVLIAVHEFGHFITAKACGVTVQEFSLGMGPLLWHKQGAETAYSLRLLPIGGYCAMEGEEEASDNPHALSNCGFFRQLLVFAAGAAMNFLLGFLIVLVLYSSAGGFLTAEIVELNEGFPNEGEDGVMVGDVLYEINGERIYNFSDVSLVMQFTSTGEDGSLEVVLLRGGEKLRRTLYLTDYVDENGEVYRAYGFTYGGRAEATALNKLKYSWYTTLDFVRMVRLSLQMLITGQAGLRDLSGPVGIVGTITEVGEQSATKAEAFGNIAYFAALISVNLAVMNLLPIPALDGGKILFLCLNAAGMLLLKKKIPARFENALSFVFFALLMAVMVLVTFSDITKLVT
ncbi:MAG: M50 family metallopeptidase [Oscillospiraceae bacterium]